ncbi:gamma-glutamylcyclotransferase family protein [Lactococcus ileimucosae]|uniref:gamma-glutamylcyclotransferase family protein n=1 Tax=Lactococcus ileimucosae TaxID=2941329 RepID=UPI0020430AE6|nr:gamma-glutamylcyclotransferase family protein [Lactococcus ileimucosae]
MLNKVFVYGSLRTDMFNYDKYLKGEVLESYPGKIKGSLFHIENKGYPAIIEGNSEILGEIFILRDFPKNIAVLDEMENFFPDNRDESEYLRCTSLAQLSDGQKEEVYYYHYNSTAAVNTKDQLIPVDSGDWLEHMAG